MNQRHLVGEMLNLVLHVVHLGIIIFSVVGWIFSATRIANLLLLLSILFSWHVLGPLLGKNNIYGYCLVTDIQWHLKKRLGHTVPEWGYMKYLADRITGRSVNEVLVERITTGVFFFCLLSSTLLLLI